MALPCGPFCCHPQCWANSKLEEHIIKAPSEIKKHNHHPQKIPMLTVQQLSTDYDKVKSSSQENLLPQLYSRFSTDRNGSGLSLPEKVPLSNYSFAEMRLENENDGSEGYDSYHYTWVSKGSPRKMMSFSEKENIPMIHTVNILQQVLPSRKKPRSGVAPQKTSVKARNFYRQHRENVQPLEAVDPGVEETILKLIASSKNALSSTDVHLSANQAYNKYASTMLPKIFRSDSIQTLIHDGTSTVGSATSSFRSRFKTKSRANGIPLTTLTLRLESESPQGPILTVTDRHVVAPMKTQKSSSTMKEALVSTGKDSPQRLFSGASTRARQGSLKPSTASSRSQRQQLTTPEEVDEPFDDPLGYLSARQNLLENVSNASDRGTDAILNYLPSLDSESMNSNRTFHSVAMENVEKIKIPAVEDVLLLAGSIMSPDSAAQTTRVPPVSPIGPLLGIGEEVESSAPSSPKPPTSPPWPGLFVSDSAEGSLANTRASSVVKRGSPTSGLNSALDFSQRETTIFEQNGE